MEMPDDEAAEGDNLPAETSAVEPEKTAPAFTPAPSLFNSTMEMPDEEATDPAEAAGDENDPSASQAESPSPTDRAVQTPRPLPPPGADGKYLVYVIPVHGEIGKPTLYIVRRALKEAIDQGVQAVVLDIDTPGGRLDVTLDIMQMLDRFEGITIAYVNTEAISAGAYISAACHSIYLEPKGVIGAAAVVSATGQEIDDTMRQKINSYLMARVRTMTEDYPYRAEVIRAMMDTDYELIVDGEELKPAGELLSLTAKEAMVNYGEPPRPLLGTGLAKDVNEVLTLHLGADRYEMRKFETTWSEDLAKYMAAISPILLGLGVLLLVIEFKTGHFGILGIIGVTLLLVVFASNYVAGLAGYEPVILFFLGVVLLGLEVLVLPGTMVFAVLGVACILGALLWSLSDVWPTPGQGPGFELEPGSFGEATRTLLLGLGISGVLLVVAWRYLPKTRYWNRFVLNAPIPVANPAVAIGGTFENIPSELPEPGATGVAATELRPNGEVIVAGRRFQATCELGYLAGGQAIIVTGRSDFALLVRPV